MDLITFHKATPNDVQTLVDNRISFALELSDKQSDDTIEALRKQLFDYFLKSTVDESCISFIAKAGDTVAGIGTVHRRDVPGNFKNLSGKWGYIMNMYTVPAFRRKGVCKGILNTLVEEGRKYGITAFELHATEEGAFVYKQNGFEIHNEPTYRKFIHK